MIRYVSFALLAAVTVIGRLGNAQTPNQLGPALPPVVSSTSELVKAFQGHSGFGTPESVLLATRRHHAIFVIWNCPYSGLDLNHIWAYHFNGGHWNQFYTGAIHAPPPAVRPAIDEGEDQLVIQGRSPSNSIKVPLKRLSLPSEP